MRLTPILLLLFTVSGFCTHPPATNDHFANSIVIVEENYAAEANFGLVTREPDEPPHNPFGAPAPALWWSWTAPDNGFFQVSVPAFAGGGNPGIAIYTGDALGNLAPLHRTSERWTLYQPATAGETYRIAIFDGSDRLNVDYRIFAIRFNFVRPPENDSFHLATPIVGDAVTFSGSTQGASSEPGEPHEGGNYGTNTVWFTWTAPHTGIVAFVPFDSEVPPMPVVYRGDSLENLTRIYAAGSWQARFDATAGVTYSIQVSGHSHGGGRFNIRLTSSALRIISPLDGTEFQGAPNAPLIIEGLPPDANAWYVRNTSMSYGAEAPPSQTTLSLADLPNGVHNIYVSATTPNGDHFYSPVIRVTRLVANDSFDQAEQLTALDAYVIGDFRGATIEPGEPRTSPPSLGSMWWKWTAPTDGKIFISEVLHYFAFELFSGDSLEALVPTPIESNPYFIVWNVKAGVTYHLRGSRLDSALDAGVAKFQFAALPSNDHFANRILLTSNTNDLQVSTGIATLEPGEPGPFLHSVWYEWVAPSHGRFIASAGTPGGYGQISLYRGDSLNQLTLLSQSDFDSTVIVAPGDSVKLRVTESENPFAIARVTTRFIPRPGNDNFSNRTILRSTRGHISGNFEQATLEALEPPLPQRERTRTIWFVCSAPDEGISTFSGVNTSIEVFTGTTLLNLTNAQYNGYSIRSSGPTTYLLRLAGSTNDAGDFQFSYRFDPRPTNDNFTAAAQLPFDSQLTWSATTRGATSELLERRPVGLPENIPFFDTVWWKWVAPESGHTQITLSEAALPEVFSGSSLHGLTLHSSWFTDPEPWANATFNATAGNTYYIRLAFPRDIPYDTTVSLLQQNRTRINSVISNGRWYSIEGITSPGVTLLLESSTNLLTWQPRLTNQLSGTNVFSFHPLLSPTIQKEFFRVRRR